MSFHSLLPFRCELSLRVQNYIVKVAGYSEVVYGQFLTTQKLESWLLRQAFCQILQVFGQILVHDPLNKHLLSLTACIPHSLIQVFILEILFKMQLDGLAAVYQQRIFGHHFEHIAYIIQYGVMLEDPRAIDEFEHGHLTKFDYSFLL